MRYPLDELLDKRSIIQLKIERISENLEKENLWKEFIDYTLAINEYIIEKVCNKEEINTWSKELYEINGQIWDLEAEIRKGREQELGLEEVGRRAIEIRRKNGIRVSIKGEIVEKTGMGYKDIKINHASDNK